MNNSGQTATKSAVAADVEEEKGDIMKSDTNNGPASGGKEHGMGDASGNAITGFIYARGCYCSDTYFIVRRGDRDADDGGIERLIRRFVDADELKDIAEKTGAKELPRTDTSYFGWEFDATGWQLILELATGRKDAGERAQRERAAKEQERRTRVYALAKSTGARQLLESYSEECNEPDCSLDNVCIWAMPDGSTEEVRNHAY
jgi:hypothetical protein